MFFLRKGTKFTIVTLVVLSVLGLFLFKTLVEDKKDGATEIYVDTLDIPSLVSHGKPILIDFTAEWCIPCRTFNPLLEQTKKELGDSVIIQIIDVDKSPEIARNYPVRVIPSQILIDSKGNPYTPTPETSIRGFISYSSNSNSDSHDLLIHEGAMTRSELYTLFKEMGMQ